LRSKLVKMKEMVHKQADPCVTTQQHLDTVVDDVRPFGATLEWESTKKF
jgi:hypothetical protein